MNQMVRHNHYGEDDHRQHDDGGSDDSTTMMMNMLTMTLLLRTCLRVALVVRLTLLEATLFSLSHLLKTSQSTDALAQLFTPAPSPAALIQLDPQARSAPVGKRKL